MALIKEPVSSEKILRKEHVLKGHFINGKNFGGLKDLSSVVRSLELKTSSGAKAVLLQPEETERWFISLHGGPESREGFELRYGGLYRELVQRKTAVLILNYRGSLGAAMSVRKNAWGRWGESICEDYSALLKMPELRELSPENATFFGVSFGGALALVLQKKFKASRVILSSPLLDLDRQMKRAGPRFEKWFRTRFSHRDFLELSFGSLTATSGNIACLLGAKDEVLGRSDIQVLKRCAPDWAIIEQDRGHAPNSYRELSEWSSAVRSFVLA